MIDDLGDDELDDLDEETDDYPRDDGLQEDADPDIDIGDVDGDDDDDPTRAGANPRDPEEIQQLSRHILVARRDGAR